MVNGTCNNQQDDHDQPTIDQIVYICSPGPSCQPLLEHAVLQLEPRSKLAYYSQSETDVVIESSVVAIGRIVFPTSESAAMVFALMNGATIGKVVESLPPETCQDEIVQLRYSRFSAPSRHDPLWISPVDARLSLQSIYNHFRAHGVITLCQRLDQSPTTIALHYLEKQDTTDAQIAHHQTTLWENVITVHAGTWPGVKAPSPSRKKSYSNEPGEPSQSRRRSHQLQIEIKPTMDLCNLYIKGLSLSMSSSELFNLFKPYGRIISARVMENAQGLSKGFGFVSYSQPIEAASALVALCGYYSIQFHEPRVLRPDHDAQQQYWCLLSSPLASYFYSNSLSSLPAASSATNPAPFYSVPPQTLHHPAHAYPSYYIYTPYATPSAYMPATTHPHYYYPSTYYPPAYQPTATNPPAISDPARVVMQHALQQVLVNDVELQATVDALMSLDPSDRQKCLEDPTFLKQQLDTLNQRSES